MEENPADERLTEAQWVARWDGERNNFTTMCEEESVYQLRPRESIIIIDSGATNTVVGTKRMENVFAKGEKPPLQKSSRSFTFGDSRRFHSLGLVEVEVVSKVSTEGEAKSFVHGVIAADVVRSNVPMLLPRVALKRMAAQLNFDTNEMTIQNKYRIRLKEVENGHLALPYIRSEGGTPSSEVIAVTSSAVNNEDVNTLPAVSVAVESRSGKQMISKIHLHLSHLNKGGYAEC